MAHRWAYSTTRSSFAGPPQAGHQQPGLSLPFPPEGDYLTAAPPGRLEHLDGFRFRPLDGLCGTKAATPLRAGLGHQRAQSVPGTIDHTDLGLPLHSQQPVPIQCHHDVQHPRYSVSSVPRQQNVIPQLGRDDGLDILQQAHDLNVVLPLRHSPPEADQVRTASGSTIPPMGMPATSR